MAEKLKQVTEGRDESTPVKVLLGVAVVIAVVFVLVGLITWLFVR